MKEIATVLFGMWLGYYFSKDKDERKLFGIVNEGEIN